MDDLQTNGTNGDEPKAETKKGLAERSRRESDSITNLQQTVTLLNAERKDLQTTIESLKEELTSAKADSKLLVEARAVTARLEEEKRQLAAEVEAGEKRADEAAEAQDLLEKTRSELEASKKETEEAIVAKEGLEAEKEELEGKEGDRVKELEKNLERAREREGVLEAEVGRLKQVSWWVWVS